MRIEDYALIGDCETAALVGRNGSIDWLCWPRFDSDACFAALLGHRANGHWQIAPARGNPTVSRRYRGDTLILETLFETGEGSVRLIDFMPIRVDGGSHLVRIAEGVSGRVPMQMEFVLRFDYGRVVPWVKRRGAKSIRAIAGPHSAILEATVPMEGRDFRTYSDFVLREGERASFVLGYRASHLEEPDAIDPEAALAETERWWGDWMKACTYEGPWAEAVRRSVITIKAMTYRPTGGIVAAPTTSLPELMGGERNWDYRYCWLRDATFMIASLLKTGFNEEALAWRDWLLRAVAGVPSQIQPLYGIAGERRLDEWEATWLSGFGGARPVRIGNAAAAQFQLDVFGEVVNALHLTRESGVGRADAGWNLQLALVEQIERVWREPDEGIWEIRGPRQHFVHSKVMCWVAIDRVIRAVEHHGLRGPVDRWRALRAEMHAEICEKGFDAERGAFVQAYGSPHLDAGVLVIPIVGFLPADDPRVVSTVRLIEEELMADGFVLRYDTRKTADGLPPGEGAFLTCSLWLAENYAMQGRREDAERLLGRLIGLCNDVGLLAEEYDPRERTFLGNFPQALSHLELVNCAHALAQGAPPKKPSLSP